MLKSWHNFKILRQSGEFIDLYEAGLMVLGFSSPTPQPDITEDVLEDMDGSIDLGATLPGRTVKANFYIESKDHTAHELMIEKIYRIFDSREPFYIIRDSQPGKRLLVRRSNGFAPSTDPSFTGEFDVEFKSNSPYWESASDTQDTIDFASDRWGIGMGFQTNKEYKYTHELAGGYAEIVYRNPGDAVLDMASHLMPMEIYMHASEASTGIEIYNMTTNTRWKLTRSIASFRPIYIEGPRTLYNYSSAFKDTNRKCLKFAPGDNDIRITGFSGTLSLEFLNRFYYL